MLMTCIFSPSKNSCLSFSALVLSAYSSLVHITGCLHTFQCRLEAGPSHADQPASWRESEQNLLLCLPRMLPVWLFNLLFYRNTGEPCIFQTFLWYIVHFSNFSRIHIVWFIHSIALAAAAVLSVKVTHCSLVLNLWHLAMGRWKVPSVESFSSFARHMFSGFPRVVATDTIHAATRDPWRTVTSIYRVFFIHAHIWKACNLATIHRIEMPFEYVVLTERADQSSELQLEAIVVQMLWTRKLEIQNAGFSEWPCQ